MYSVVRVFFSIIGSMLWKALRSVERESGNPLSARENHSAVFLRPLDVCDDGDGGRKSARSSGGDGAFVFCGGYCEAAEAEDVYALRPEHGASDPSDETAPWWCERVGSSKRLAKDSAALVRIPVNRAGGEGHEVGDAGLMIGGVDLDSMDHTDSIAVVYLTSSPCQLGDAESTSKSALHCHTEEVMIRTEAMGSNRAYSGNAHNGGVVPYSGQSFGARWRHCAAASAFPVRTSPTEATVVGFEVIVFGGEVEAFEERSENTGPDRVGAAVNDMWRISGVAWFRPLSAEEGRQMSNQLFFSHFMVEPIPIKSESGPWPSPRYLAAIAPISVVSSAPNNGPKRITSRYVLYGGAQDRPDEFPETPVQSLNDAFLLEVTSSLSFGGEVGSVVGCTWRMNEMGPAAPPPVNGHVGWTLHSSPSSSESACFFGGKQNATGNDDFHIFSVGAGCPGGDGEGEVTLRYRVVRCPFPQDTYATLDEEGGRVLADTETPWPFWRYCAAVAVVPPNDRERCIDGPSSDDLGVTLLGGNCRHPDAVTAYRLFASCIPKHSENR